MTRVKSKKIETCLCLVVDDFVETVHFIKMLIKLTTFRLLLFYKRKILYIYVYIYIYIHVHTYT